MNNTLVIARNELRLFFKNRSAYIWIFVVPLLFVALFSFVPTGPGKSSNRLPPVIVENADTGYLGKIYDDVLGAQGLWRLDQAKDKRNKPVANIRIPADFTARILAKQPVNVEFTTLPAGGSASSDAALIEARILRSLIVMNSHLLEATGAGTEGVAQASLPAISSSAAPEAGAAAGRSAPQLQPSTSTPLPAWPPSEEAVRAVVGKPALVVLDAKFAGRRPIPTGIGFSLPGNLTYFLMMNLLIFGGSTVAATRRSGVLKRLLTLPVRRGELVLGQILGLWLLGAVQVAFLLLVGHLAGYVGVHLNLGANLPAVLLVLSVFAWVAAALGVLVGSLLDSPDRVVGVCVAASMIMALLGGCWVPAELMPAWMRTAGHCIPTGWALDALHQLITFGADFSVVLKPVAMLCGFGVAATAAAARWFRA